MVKRTDEQLLRLGFDYCLRYSVSNNSKDMMTRLFRNGFDEPVDEDMLPPVIYDFAERIGLKLVNGMWEEVDGNKTQ